MLTSLNGLFSLDQITHIVAAPLIRTGSDFTHMLHSRYTSKEDLAAYSSHPNHVSVVKDSVLPNCDDIMAVDWVGDVLGRVSVVSASEWTATGKREGETRANGEGKV
ncbi:hypothetical protein ACFE04_021844 [Oxalis oulophora]